MNGFNALCKVFDVYLLCSCLHPPAVKDRQTNMNGRCLLVKRILEVEPFKVKDSKIKAIGAKLMLLLKEVWVLGRR